MADSLYNGLKISADIVSDVHFDIHRKNKLRTYLIFCSALKSAKKDNADVFITVGDTTSRGLRKNWDYVRKVFKKVKNPTKNIIFTLGNHDCWSDGEDEYACGMAEYYSICRDVMGRSFEKPYFTTVINGYTFICLGNESDMGDDADITDVQLAWLKAELAKATEDNKPVFVFCHQSLNGRHGLPRTWESREIPDRDPLEGGVGACSDELAAILKSFKNVFYFSGHSHMGFAGERMKKSDGYSTFQCEDGVTLANLPTLTRNNHHGEINGFAYGLRLEVYDDKVCLRPKCYRPLEYITDVPMKDGKPYYEVELVD